MNKYNVVYKLRNKDCKESFSSFISASKRMNDLVRLELKNDNTDKPKNIRIIEVKS
jgi:hypothetical protein